ESMADVLFHLQDRRERDFVLGPTHEEVVVDLFKRQVRSYRDMPVLVYQLQTKFRDEARPRGGLMRVREFTMKDAYSFDADWDGLDVTYQAANEEKADHKKDELPFEEMLPLEKVSTPGQKTIDDLVEFLGVPHFKTLK